MNPSSATTYAPPVPSSRVKKFLHAPNFVWRPSARLLLWIASFFILSLVTTVGYTLLLLVLPIAAFLRDGGSTTTRAIRAAGTFAMELRHRRPVLGRLLYWSLLPFGGRVAASEGNAQLAALQRNNARVQLQDLTSQPRDDPSQRYFPRHEQNPPQSTTTAEPSAPAASPNDDEELYEGRVHWTAQPPAYAEHPSNRAKDVNQQTNASAALHGQWPPPPLFRRAVAIRDGRHTYAVDVIQTQLNDPYERPRRVLVFIPGNPGLPDLYASFIREFHQHTGIFCVILAYAGHSPLSRTPRRFNLEQQIHHKKLLLNKLRTEWAEDATVWLAGHSTGAYISMHLLDTVSWLHKSRGIMLFPTLHHIGTSPAGQRLYPLLFFMREALARFADVLHRMPVGIQKLCVRAYLAGDSTPLAVEMLRHLLDADIVDSSVYLARDEFKKMMDLDVGLCQRLQDRLSFWFADCDKFVTGHHAADIADACPRSEIHNCKIDMCHGFLVNRSKELANIMTSYFSGF